MKVDFLIAGITKGGTTALHHFLKDHPEICMSKPKELHFFNQGYFDYSDSPTSIVNYHSHFEVNKQTKVCGESTPDYMYRKQAPKRIKKYNPKMKLIFLLRNPIDRAYSDYQMKRRMGF